MPDNDETLTSAATATVEATVPGAPSPVAAKPAGTGEIEVSWGQPELKRRLGDYGLHRAVEGDRRQLGKCGGRFGGGHKRHPLHNHELEPRDGVYSARHRNQPGWRWPGISRRERQTADAQTSGQQGRAENTPATGGPTIGGTLEVGQTLTASTAGIDDADGLANATFSYQWARKRRDRRHGHPGMRQAPPMPWSPPMRARRSGCGCHSRMTPATRSR